MWCLGTWFSGGLSSARLTVGLNQLKGLFQPEGFYDSFNLEMNANGIREISEEQSQHSCPCGGVWDLFVTVEKTKEVKGLRK